MVDLYLKKVFFALLILPVFLSATPLAPSHLTLSADSSSSVSLSWQDNSDNELGFKIFRNDVLIDTLSAGQTTYHDTGLSAHTTYTYMIKATDDTIAEPVLPNVHINEVLASNVDIQVDPDFYEFSDYIELKNFENHTIDIGGYVISDDKKSWTIPSGTTIAAHGFLLIWADEKDFVGNGLHTNFKLSKKKEKVTLKDSAGATIDFISYKKLSSNTSVKVIGGEVVYMIPSPEAENGTVYTKLTLAQEPVFSEDSGFYTGAQTVSISSENATEIYYTVDGSVPTKNSLRYTATLTVSSTTVIKAIAYASGTVASKVVTKSYIIGLDTDMAVLSLSLDDKYLFDNYIGIYVEGLNGKQSAGCYFHLDDDPMNFNQDWERPVSVEYFDPNNQSVFNVTGELSIGGQCSRYNRYGKRSFAVELDDTLEYQLYNDKQDVLEHDDFKIRGGGNGYKINDILLAKVTMRNNLNVDSQADRPVQMFMNGEYWGIYNIREKKGKDYIKANYPDVDKKKLDIIAHVSGEDRAKVGNTDAFTILYDFVYDHDLSNSSNYQQLLDVIDIDNYIDYMSVMLYSGNGDWIYNNTRWWRERKEGAKWRWMLDDVDDAFSHVHFDSFNHAKKTSTFMSKLFNKLLSNSTFKSRFKSRFNDLLDTTFSNANISPLIDEVSASHSYFDLERDKWTHDGDHISQSKFNSSINTARDFARDRVSYVRDKLNAL